MDLKECSNYTLINSTQINLANIFHNIYVHFKEGKNKNSVILMQLFVIVFYCFQMKYQNGLFFHRYTKSTVLFRTVYFSLKYDMQVNVYLKSTRNKN